MQGANQQSLEQFLGAPPASSAQLQAVAATAAPAGSQLESYLGAPSPQVMAQAQTQQGMQYPTAGPLNQAINQAVPAVQNIPVVGNTIADMLRGAQATNFMGPGVPMSLMQGVGQGVQSALSGAVSLANVPWIRNAIPGLNMISGNIPNIPNPQALQNPISPATAFMGNVASSALLPEAKVLDAASSAIPLAAKVAPIVNTAATGAGYGALYGNANGNTAGAGQIAASALMPTAIQGLFKAPAAAATLGMKGLSYLANKGSNDLLTPAQVAVRSAQVGNAPVSFGSMVNSPTLNWMYNRVMGTIIPFSGVANQMRKTVDAFNNQGQNVTQQLLGNTAPEDVPSSIASEIKNNFQTNKTNASNMYEDAINTADSNNFNLVSTPNVNAYLQKEQQDNTIPEGLENIASSYLDGSAFKRNADNIVPLRQAQSMISSLGTQAASIASNPKGDQNQARWLYGLQGALDSDIEANLQGSPALGKYQQARAYFSNNVAPYKSPQIYPIAKGYVDNPQNLSNVLAKNQTPQIRTVVNQLSPESKNLTLYDLFDNASKKDEEGNQVTDAARLSNAYSSLSPNATNLLASPQIQNEFNKLATLKNVTQAAQLKINAPYTGGRTPEYLSAGAGLGGMYALAHHPALLPLIPAAIGANRMGARFLESPGLRQAYINQSVPRLTNPNSIFGKGVNILKQGANAPVMSNLMNQIYGSQS